MAPRRFMFRGGTRDGQVHDVHYTARYIIVPVPLAKVSDGSELRWFRTYEQIINGENDDTRTTTKDQRYKLTTIRDEDGRPIGHEYVLEDPALNAAPESRYDAP